MSDWIWNFPVALAAAPSTEVWRWRKELCAGVQEGYPASIPMRRDALRKVERELDRRGLPYVGPDGDAPLRVLRSPPPSFWAYVYVVASDAYEWRRYTRESLLDLLVKRALIKRWTKNLGREPSRFERRVLTCDLARMSLDYHAEGIISEWNGWWREHQESVRLAIRIGIDGARALSHETLRDLLTGGDTPGDTPNGAVGA